MPHFKLEVTAGVKKEAGWEVTALATVLYRNRPPDPPEEVVFNVNGEEFERTETDPESGIARSVMILQSGGYVVAAIRPRARPDDRDARRTRSFAIREEREPTEDEKKLADLKSKIKLAEAEQELKKLIEEKPKKPEEEVLESERLELQADEVRLNRTRVARQLKEEKKEEKEPTPDEKKLAELKTQTELVKAEKELEKARQEEVPKPKQMTPVEEAIASVKSQTELVKAEKALKEAQQEPMPDEKEIAALKIRAQLIGAQKEFKEAIEGKIKLPKNVLVSVSGAPGKQKFLISIAAEDGTFIPNQPFTLVDGDHIAVCKTGKNGVATHKTDFTEPSRYFEVRAGNAKDLVWQEQVPGPPAEPLQPEFRRAPDPSDYFERGRVAARRHFRRQQRVN